MGLWSRFLRTWRGGRHSDDIREELQFHLDMDMAGGHERRDAHIRFGNRRRIEEDTRQAGIVEWLDSSLSDLAFAARHLAARPGFTLVAVATLAIGIGATAAIFAAVNAALLRPLPYPDARHVYALGTLLTDGRYSSGRVATIEATRLNRLAPTVVAAAVVRRNDSVVQGADGISVQAIAFDVSRGFFDVVGLPMTAGRPFEAPDHVVGAPYKVIVSHRFWRQHLGADKDIVGKPLHLGTASATIVGIAAPGVDLPPGADLWMNLRTPPDNPARSFAGYLRARPDATRERLDSEMSIVMSGLAEENPTLAKGRIFTLRPLVDFVIGDLGPLLIVVLSGAAILLLLGCVNVANLLLARGATRAREMALRSALGAGRWRITRQLLSEAFVLAACGGVVGFFFAWGGLRVLETAGASHLPRLDSVPLDWRVLAFATFLLFAVTLLVGLVPAARLARTNLQGLIVEGGRSATGGPGGNRAIGALVIAQIGLAIALVAGAGWVVRGFSNLTSVNSGFVAEGRLVFDALLTQGQYRTAASVEQWFTELSAKLHAIPGVTSIGSASSFPLRPDWDDYYYIGVQGEVFDASTLMTGRMRRITPGFLATLGVPLLAGREFTADDRHDTAPVAIINRTFRDRYLGGKDPLATQFAYGFPTPGKTIYKIVGVSEDVRHISPTEPADPSFYVPQSQIVAPRQTIVVATSVSNPASLIPELRKAIHDTDPNMPGDVELLSDNVAASLSRQRIGLVLMGIFAVTALGLAAIGIYGVIACAASLRLREIATRMALGATPSRVFWMMLRQSSGLGIAGLVTGIGMAAAMGRLVSTRLYEVRVTDPQVLSLAVGLLALITFFAIVIPARRAAGIDSATHLRSE